MYHKVYHQATKGDWSYTSKIAEFVSPLTCERFLESFSEWSYDKSYHEVVFALDYEDNCIKSTVKRGIDE